MTTTLTPEKEAYLSSLSQDELKALANNSQPPAEQQQKEEYLKSLSPEDLKMLAGKSPDVRPQNNIPSQVVQDKYKIWKDNPKTASVLFGMREPFDALAQIPPALLASAFRKAGLKDTADYFENEAHTVNKDAKEAYATARQGDTSFDTARLIGNIASPVNIGGGMAVGSATKGLGLMGQSVAQGLLGGATQQADDSTENVLDQKIGQVGISVLGSHLINTFGKVLGSALMPKLSDQLQKLKDAGVDINKLSIGQALGGIYKKTEDFLRDVVPGGAVERAQQQGVNEFSKGLVRNIATDLGLDVPEHFNTQQTIDLVDGQIGKMYNTILPKIGTIEPTNKANRLSQASLLYAQKNINDPEVLKEYNQLVNMVNKRYVVDPTAGKFMYARNFKDLDSRLGSEINSAFSSTADNAVDQREKAKALLLLQQSLRDMAEAKDPTGILKKANSAHSALSLPKRTAGGSVEALKNESSFTPSQLMTQVKNENTTENLAKGKAKLQKEAQAGVKVLGQKTPSMEQRMLEKTIAGAGLGLSGYLGGPETAGLLGAGITAGTNAVYNPLVQQALVKTLVNRPAWANAITSPVAKVVNKLTPAVNPSLSTAVGAPLAQAGQRMMGDQNADVPMQQPIDLGTVGGSPNQ